MCRPATSAPAHVASRSAWSSLPPSPMQPDVRRAPLAPCVKRRAHGRVARLPAVRQGQRALRTRPHPAPPPRRCQTQRTLSWRHCMRTKVGGLRSQSNPARRPRPGWIRRSAGRSFGHGAPAQMRDRSVRDESWHWRRERSATTPAGGPVSELSEHYLFGRCSRTSCRLRCWLLLREHRGGTRGDTGGGGRAWAESFGS